MVRNKKRHRDLRFATLLATGVVTVGAAAPPVGTPLNFVACPVARDTGPETDLCFFAEYEGETYALVNPADWGKPQLKHQVLVEARVVDGAPVCGATPLDARISVLPEVDTSCDSVIPFDGSVRGKPGGIFNNGTPEQLAAARELARRVEADPALSLVPIMRETSYPIPAAPFSREELIIHYPFGSDRATDGDMIELLRLTHIAKTTLARVEVTGYRGASHLGNGETMTEDIKMARQRAEKIGNILIGLGVAAEQITVDWVDRAQGNTGKDDWLSRRIELQIIP